MDDELRFSRVYERKLSAPQLRVLHNLCTGASINVHLRGGSMHGAFGQTLQSLQDRDLFRRNRAGDGDFYEMTRKGVREHREHCCKRGITENDILVKEVEKKLAGEDAYVDDGGEA